MREATSAVEMELNSSSHGSGSVISLQQDKEVPCRRSSNFTNRNRPWIPRRRHLLLALHLLFWCGCFSNVVATALASHRPTGGVFATLQGSHEQLRNLRGSPGEQRSRGYERETNVILARDFRVPSWNSWPSVEVDRRIRSDIAKGGVVETRKQKQVGLINWDPSVEYSREKSGEIREPSGSECIRHIRGSNCGTFQRYLNGKHQGHGRATFGESGRRILADSDNRTEAEVLLSWRASLIEGPKFVLANWNIALEPNFCLWRGISCVNDTSQVQHVSTINLSGSKLSGNLSVGLSALSYLTTLDMSYNRLTGGIPDDLIEISSLQTIDLSYNRIDGVIPRFGNGPNASSLRSLNLTRNRLTEGIPTSLGQCKQLEILNLNRNILNGSIPSELGGLPNLQELHLFGNRLDGTLPPALGECRNLLNFSAGWNRIDGRIPDEYASLVSLRGLYVDGNSLIGEIPEWLSSFSSLLELRLNRNNFTGPIPSFSRNQNLTRVNLSNNSFVGGIPTALVQSFTFVELILSGNLLNGTIPDAFVQGNSLQRLLADQNRLTGPIPTSLGNCAQMTELVLSRNELTGPIFGNVGGLTHLEVLELDDNSLNGTIPDSISNCFNLSVLNLARNGLTGRIPSGIGQLTNLVTLDLSYNRLGGFLPNLAGLSQLQSLVVDQNLLSGSIPAELGNLRQLQVLSLGGNAFYGNIPSSLSQCVSLRNLILDNNNLTGTIPGELGQLSSLSVLHLQGNMLVGGIPWSTFSNSQMSDFVVSDNRLTGEIDRTLPSLFSQLKASFSVANNRLTGPLPAELGLLTAVRNMNLSGNQFSGGIPEEIGNCTALRQLDLASNNLIGGLPASLGRLSSLQSLNASHNELTGPIPPDTVGRLSSLRQLDLSHNKFSGQIPANLSSSLRQLDLSYNNFSGQIPASISAISNLRFLNLSDNNLQGAVPENGIFRNFNASSFLGNPNLCGRVLGIGCSGPHSDGSALPVVAWVFIALGAALVLILALLALLIGGRMVSTKRSPRKTGSIIARSELFYPQLRFTVPDLKQATENFSDSNIIGNGSLSTVYRGVLPELVLVAVKKLRTQDGAEIPSQFVEELDELGKLRHKHLVAILGYCFDPQMHALVVQFMSNGSLEDHLHGGQRCELEWAIRSKVGIGVAKALTFLHHGCGTVIVHSDLKPSNILLDAEFEAHLEDFSLSRLIFANKLMEMTHSSVGSSLDYFPPEYSYSPVVTPKGDVYSYGILLLELLTGKKPNSTMFKDDMTLTKWCRGAFPEKMADVLDPYLIGSKETNHKQVALFMKVALMCVKENPDERPSMNIVLESLR